MRQRTTLLILAALVAMPLVLTGCPKKSKTATTPGSETTTATPTPTPSKPPTKEVKDDDFKGEGTVEKDIDQGDLEGQIGDLRTVYFAFDSYELTPSSVATLRQNAEQLKDSPSAAILIEGHADERGSVEYNLALGEKRARAVRDYLASLGIDASRVRITTYGEERPATPGHEESAYSKNRRAEFVAE